MTTPKVQLSDVTDLFGSGGANIPPGGGGGTPSMRDVARNALQRVGPIAETSAELTASLAADRFDGQLRLKADNYTMWVWKAADATAADSSHIAPTDVGAGAGRWVLVALAASTDATNSVDGLLSAADKTKLDGMLKGTGTLVAGVSGAISVPGLTATGRIVATRRDHGASTAIGHLAAKAADRVTGAGGTFKITAQKADATTETADVSTFDWQVEL